MASIAENGEKLNAIDSYLTDLSRGVDHAIATLPDSMMRRSVDVHIRDFALRVASLRNEIQAARCRLPDNGGDYEIEPLQAASHELHAQAAHLIGIRDTLNLLNTAASDIMDCLSGADEALLAIVPALMEDIVSLDSDLFTAHAVLADDPALFTELGHDLKKRIEEWRDNYNRAKTLCNVVAKLSAEWDAIDGIINDILDRETQRQLIAHRAQVAVEVQDAQFKIHNAQFSQALIALERGDAACAEFFKLANEYRRRVEGLRELLSYFPEEKHEAGEVIKLFGLDNAERIFSEGARKKNEETIILRGTEAFAAFGD